MTIKYSDAVREIVAAKLAVGAKIDAVSQEHGIPKRTLIHWLDGEDIEFLALVHRYKQEVLDSVIGEVSTILPDAFTTLKRNLTCGNAHAEVRAALGLISAFLRVRDGADVSDRVAKLEMLLKTEEEGL